jgi:multicomponent K+:H+ antiporter subunit G
VLHELLIAVFTVLTTPVTLILLARAALYRDRREGRGDVPPLRYEQPLSRAPEERRREDRRS